MTNAKNIFELYGHKSYPLTFSMKYEEAKKLITQGLDYFVGNGRAKWLEDYDNIASWLSNNNGKGLLLCGSNGLGKSLICTKILPIILANRLDFDSYKDFCVVKATDLRVGNLPLLAKIYIVDDIGVESVQNEYGSKHDLVSEIIDYCESSSKLFIGTTNLTPTELEQRYGLRTIDRLKAITKCFTMIGDSFRYNSIIERCK